MADTNKTITDKTNNVAAQTEDLGYLKDGQRASYIRYSMENKNLLENKYDIYVGTGEVTGTDVVEQGVSRETKGINIIDAINEAAVDNSEEYHPVKCARWGVESITGQGPSKTETTQRLVVANGGATIVDIIGGDSNGLISYNFKKNSTQTSLANVNVGALGASTVAYSPNGGPNSGGIIRLDSNKLVLQINTNGVSKSISLLSDGKNDGIHFTGDLKAGESQISAKQMTLTNTNPSTGSGLLPALIVDDGYVGIKKSIYMPGNDFSSVGSGNNTIEINGSIGTITAKGAITSIEGQIEGLSFNATSDERLKTNIQTLNYHDSILDVPVREYDWKATGKHAIGFVAQELQKVYPELVDEGENGILSIKETKLVYLLMEEVKKLKEEIENLKKEG